MSIFFGIPELDSLTSEITIPRFRNSGLTSSNAHVFQLTAEDGFWSISLIEEFIGDFVTLKSSDFDFSNSFFTICDIDVISKQAPGGRMPSLVRMDNFTKTHPDFRANVCVKTIEGARSSYQGEYPFEMLKVKSGSISNASLLGNDLGATYLILVSVSENPAPVTSACDIICAETRTVVETFEISSNSSTIRRLPDDIVAQGCYVSVRDLPAIPIYVVCHEGGLSMEHTHPPHEAFMGNSIRRIISNYKEGFNEP